jgi:speckle-type POZ protein
MRCDIIVANACAPVIQIQVPRSSICQHLNRLLETEVGADVTFEVVCETFAAQRCVLAARSAVFMAELFGPMKEGTTAGVI